MPNRKVSHLRAKLEGGSVNETFDIHDENALHDLGKNAVFIGDSYLSNTTTNWATLLASYLNLDSYVISYRGGTGFAGEVDGITFYQLVEAANPSDPNAITHVFIGGGTNDIFTSVIDNVPTNIISVCNLVRTRFPNAEIYIALTDAWISDVYDWAKRDLLFINYATGCARAGAHFCGAVGNGAKIHRSTMLQSDLKHPTVDGSWDIATRFALGMDGMSYCTNLQGIADNQYYVREENDVLYVEFYTKKQYTVSIASFTCNGENVISISVGSGHILTTSTNLSAGTAELMIQANGKYYTMTSRILPTPTGFDIYPYCLTTDNTNFLTLTNLTRVHILGGTNYIMPAHCLG